MGQLVSQLFTGNMRYISHDDNNNNNNSTTSQLEKYQLSYNIEDCIKSPYLMINSQGMCSIDKMNIDNYHYHGDYSLRTNNGSLEIELYTENEAQDSVINHLASKLIRKLDTKKSSKLSITGKIMLIKSEYFDSSGKKFLTNFSLTDLEAIQQLLND